MNDQSPHPEVAGPAQQKGESESRPSSSSMFRLTALVVIAIVGVVLWQVLAQNITPSKIAAAGVSVDFAPKETERIPAATREFVVGRWMVRQQEPDGSMGETFLDYEQNGTFSGQEELVANSSGKMLPMHGRWHVEIVGKSRFVLRVTFDDGRTWSGTFDILDNNRIQNTDVNYVANRV